MADEKENQEIENNNQEVVDNDFLNMSDEDFLKLDSSAMASGQVNSEENTDEDKPDETDEEKAAREAAEAEAQAAEQAAAEAADKEKEGQNDDKKVDDTKPTQAPTAAPTQAPKEAPKAGDKQDKEDGDKDGKAKAVDTTATTDYKAFHDRIMAPFKANGRDMQVENVDEAIQLMQMGANYNKKMAGLKPNLALIKMLDNAKLLDADKIGFLIDLHNKVPEAINKLVKDSGIDPMDLSADKAGDYKPGNHKVSQTEVDLDTVLDDLKEAPEFARTVQVATDWDVQSKQVIAQNPNLLRVINGHMQNGVFDLVHKEIARRAALGRLNGLSDIEAYRQVGDEMAASGKFDHLSVGSGQNQDDKGQQTTTAKTVVPPKPKQADDSTRDDKRRAAAPAKAAVSSAKTVSSDFNPLAMSDAEFLKLNPKFQ